MKNFCMCDISNIVLASEWGYLYSGSLEAFSLKWVLLEIKLVPKIVILDFRF
jgi:hypothetical protein